MCQSLELLVYLNINHLWQVQQHSYHGQELIPTVYLSIPDLNSHIILLLLSSSHHPYPHPHPHSHPYPHCKGQQDFMPLIRICCHPAINNIMVHYINNCGDVIVSTYHYMYIPLANTTIVI